jgi:hypothetical protein
VVTAHKDIGITYRLRTKAEQRTNLSRIAATSSTGALTYHLVTDVLLKASKPIEKMDISRAWKNTEISTLEEDWK